PLPMRAAHREGQALLAGSGTTQPFAQVRLALLVVRSPGAGPFPGEQHRAGLILHHSEIALGQREYPLLLTLHLRDVDQMVERAAMLRIEHQGLLQGFACVGRRPAVEWTEVEKKLAELVP